LEHYYLCSEPEIETSGLIGIEVSMARHNVLVFKVYPLEVGQKIRIDGGPRGGDWEVIGVSDRKMKLRCPISFKEVEWDRFCCLAQELADEEWPQQH
jgi:hypothetical protein